MHRRSSRCWLKEQMQHLWLGLGMRRQRSALRKANWVPFGRTLRNRDVPVDLLHFRAFNEKNPQVKRHYCESFHFANWKYGKWDCKNNIVFQLHTPQKRDWAFSVVGELCWRGWQRWISPSQVPQPTLRSDFQVSWRIWLNISPLWNLFWEGKRIGVHYKDAKGAMV